MRAKISRACRIAATITDNPGASSTTSAAARAASVAPATAIPASACLSAGASLTPSPVIPTMPAGLQEPHDAIFVLGKHLGEPVGRAHPGGQFGVIAGGVEGGGIQDVLAQADLVGDFAADGDLIAGDHHDLDAEVLGSSDGDRGVHAGRVGQRQHTHHAPDIVAVGSGHTEGSVTMSGEPVDYITDLAGRAVLVTECGDDLWRALADPESVSMVVYEGFGALVDRVERGEPLDTC